jgi:hypothetical protein
VRDRAGNGRRGYDGDLGPGGGRSRIFGRRRLMALGGGEKYAVGLRLVGLEEVVDEVRGLRDEVRDEESADEKPADHASEE